MGFLITLAITTLITVLFEKINNTIVSIVVACRTSKIDED